MYLPSGEVTAAERIVNGAKTFNVHFTKETSGPVFLEILALTTASIANRLTPTNPCLSLSLLRLNSQHF